SVSAPSAPSQSRASAARNCCATRIGAERSRYRTRRRSPGSAVTRPVSASRARCLAIACRVIGSSTARSVAVAGPLEASAARMARRVGSARAVKTCSAIASMSSSIEVGSQLAKLLRPALGVAVVRLAVDVLGQLRETGFDHRQPRADTGRFERELDVSPTRIVRGQPVDAPGEPEHRPLLPPLHPHLGRDPFLLPPHPGRSARAQVDRRFVAEPGAQALGRGERGPHLLWRVSDLHGALDAIRKSHDALQQVATDRLPYYGNRSVASRRRRTPPISPPDVMRVEADLSEKLPGPPHPVAGLLGWSPNSCAIRPTRPGSCCGRPQAPRLMTGSLPGSWPIPRRIRWP